MGERRHTWAEISGHCMLMGGLMTEGSTPLVVSTLSSVAVIESGETRAVVANATLLLWWTAAGLLKRNKNSECTSTWESAAFEWISEMVFDGTAIFNLRKGCSCGQREAETRHSKFHIFNSSIFQRICKCLAKCKRVKIMMAIVVFFSTWWPSVLPVLSPFRILVLVVAVAPKTSFGGYDRSTRRCTSQKMTSVWTRTRYAMQSCTIRDCDHSRTISATHMCSEKPVNAWKMIT